MNSTKKHLSLYGSCVSRDTVSFCASDSLLLKRYIARQSLISAWSPPLDLDLDLSVLTSEFQKRMVTEDLARSLQHSLPLIAEDSDLLLWDLVDERLGVYRFDDGNILTRSLELITSGAEEYVKTQATHIPFGSNAHFELWTAALGQFVQALDAVELRNRVHLLSIPWAARDTRGQLIPPSMGTAPKKANKLYQRYFDAASQHVDTLIVGTVTEPRGSDEHRWGLAPFHYEDRVYHEIITALGLSPSRS